jgi:hypothetical protein
MESQRVSFNSDFLLKSKKKRLTLIYFGFLKPELSLCSQLMWTFTPAIGFPIPILGRVLNLIKPLI